MSGHCSTGHCGSGCQPVRACPCPVDGNPGIDSLEKVVSCFWQNHQELAVERDYYQSLGTLEQAIDEAAQALADENLAYGQPDRIPHAVLTRAREALLGRQAALEGHADFDRFYEAVDQAIGHLEGISPALVYLTALRIALQAGVVPDKIYLDDAARAGAGAVVALDASERVLSRDRLPRIFRHPELAAEDVQSCLTICRNQLQWLGRRP